MLCSLQALTISAWVERLSEYERALWEEEEIRGFGDEEREEKEEGRRSERIIVTFGDLES
jgi:hypothetical protein